MMRIRTPIGEAVPICDEFRPGLILLDPQLPCLDGFEVMNLLRGSIQSSEYRPILILTASDSPDARREAR